jgi:hypothetical protein
MAVSDSRRNGFGLSKVIIRVESVRKHEAGLEMNQWFYEKTAEHCNLSYAMCRQR